MMDVRSQPPSALKGRYYQEAASWSADVNGSLRTSRRIAWIIAAAAGVIAVLEALALAALAPLKTVVPYTITVDRQTGYVQMMTGLKPGFVSQDQAVTQSFLVQYVMARETFDATDLRENYRKVMLWSAGEARRQYQALMQRSTPQSPLNLYTASSLVSVTIKSVSLLSPTTALVRFETNRQDAEAAVGPAQPYAAVIAFHYVNAPMATGDRFVNPLGFQVTRYRRDSETPQGGAPAYGTATVPTASPTLPTGAASAPASSLGQVTP